ncbi:hypothetical protein FB446DRAFT_645122, partial [Lentinula raphanica]
DQMIVSSEDESDGTSAMQKVEEVERSRRGPKTDTLHFWSERLVKEDGKLKWEFKCKLCKTKITKRRFPATVGCQTFEDEHPKPNISNLTLHLKSAHPDRNQVTEVSEDTPDPLAASAAFLHSFIDKGKLNPAVEPTEKGFYQMFSAWVFEEGLPFTTGESPALRRLFEYLHVAFTPPTDTTAIDEWTFRNKDFRAISLRENDWIQLEQIERVLEVFTSVTLQMSRSDTPTIPYVLPMYRHMEITLQELEADVTLLFSIQAAVTVGLQKLAKYHELAKRNQFYVIATST